MRFEAVIRFGFDGLTTAKSVLATLSFSDNAHSWAEDGESGFNVFAGAGETSVELFDRCGHFFSEHAQSISECTKKSTGSTFDIAVELRPHDSFPVFSFVFPSEPLARIATAGLKIKITLYAVEE